MRRLIVGSVFVLALIPPCVAQNAQTEVEVETPLAADEEGPLTYSDTVTNELLILEEEVRALRATLDTFMTTTLQALREENEYLRHELRRAYNRPEEGSAFLPPATVPRPNRGLMEQVLGVTSPNMQEADSDPIAPIQPEATFTIVKEWGRSPEEAITLGSDVSSLIGLIAYVPPETDPETLRNLGRSLRRDYAAFDNVNIEVFNDRPAAQQYADSNQDSGGHRVLTISKHKASGRDMILLHDGDTALNVTIGAEE